MRYGRQKKASLHQMTKYWIKAHSIIDSKMKPDSKMK